MVICGVLFSGVVGVTITYTTVIVAEVLLFSLFLSAGCD